MGNVNTLCRSCGGSHLNEVLNLGATPLADALLTDEQLSQPEKTYPLTVVFCHECSLMQIVETVPPEELFCNDYPYFSSFSDLGLRNAEEISKRLIESRRLDSNSLVVEPASSGA